MYIVVEDGPGRMKRYIAVRGTSQLEGFHHHLADLLVGSNYSAALAGALVTIHNYRWGSGLVAVPVLIGAQDGCLCLDPLI